MKQIIDGDTTDYLYDAANRLEQVNGQTTHTYDANGNLLSTEVLTNVFDTANRLVETSRAGTTVEPLYDGLGHRVAQTKGATTTTFALDVGVGLPEVIYTSEDTAYLHLPGVIMTENISGEIRYLLSDGLGSVRHAVDENSLMVAYHEYDPYGNPTDAGPLTTDYGYTGEWWQDEVELLHLRARWYLPEEGVFLSRDPVESEPPYQYVGGNPINRVDPSGMQPPICQDGSTQICYDPPIGTPDLPELTLPSTTIGPRLLQLYNGEYGPLRNQLDEFTKTYWPIEKNLFSNDRFQYGILTFGDYALRVDMPKTTPNLLDPAGSRLIVPNAAFRSVYKFQGYLNMANFSDGVYFQDRAFAYNRANQNPINNGWRPGTIAEYTRLRVTLSGYAYFIGPGRTAPPIKPGALPRTRFLGEEGKQDDQPRPIPPNFAFDRSMGIGLGRTGNYIQTLNTISPGLRRYQVIIQENILTNQCHDLGGRWRALIQTYSLLFTPYKRQPIIWQNHLIKEPNGIAKEVGFWRQ